MTWSDIQLASIRKMFVNTTAISVEDLDTMRTDKKYITYLDAMPDAANEGIMIMVTRGKPKMSRRFLTIDMVSTEYEINGYYCFDVTEKLDNYLSMEKLYVDGAEYNGYILRNNELLYIPKNIVDTKSLVISYESYPDKITKETPDDTKIDLQIDMLNILPLYIASELYKDDDIALATYYRNEFETELGNMRKEPTDLHFTDVNGWL